MGNPRKSLKQLAAEVLNAEVEKVNEQRGPFFVESRTVLYKNPWGLQLRHDNTRIGGPEGDPGIYDTVKINPGATIAPVDDDGNIHLAYGWQHGIGGYSLELPGGGINIGTDRDARAGAARELEEELGFKAHTWIPLATTNQLTGIIDHTENLYLARGLRMVGANQGDTEQIERKVVSLDEAVHLVMKGEISDAPAGLAILKSHAYIQDPEKFSYIKPITDSRVA